MHERVMLTSVLQSPAAWQIVFRVETSAAAAVCLHDPS